MRIGIIAILAAIVMLATIQSAAADPVGAFAAQGTVQYEDGTTCPYGWDVWMENLDRPELEGQPWHVISKWLPSGNDYFIGGETVADSDHIKVTVTSPDGSYNGTNTMVASEAWNGVNVIINVVVYPVAPQTYTISGYTDPAADRVNITNLNKSDIVKDRSADFIGLDGFYNLTLNVTDEVEAGNVLRITACDVTSDYESNCNVSTHEVVNAPGEDDNVNLTLNHYCLNFYPSFPFTTWEQEDWSGPTVMEMLIDHYLDPPDVPNQTVLNEAGIGNNQGCNADLQYVDPRGMRYTLNDYLYYPYSPYIAHYGIGSYTAVEGALHYICYWQHLGPGAAPTYGNYSNWMAIRGIHTSENPYPQSAGSYDIYGFWINDPNPTGIGENTYKTVDQWTDTYFKNLTGVRDGDIYKNRYVAVCEPPVQPDVDVRLVHSKARFSGVITSDAADEELAVNVNGVPLNQVICNRKLDREKENKVVQAAIDSVNEGLISYDPDFKEAFDGTVANKPMPVKSDTGDYYLVPFGIESDGMSVTAVVIVDSDGGKFKEASWVREPAKYLPVTAQDALKIVYREMKGKSTVKVLEKEKVTGKFKKINIEDVGVDTVGITHDEVEKQSRKAYLELVCRDGSPYYPDWKITIGENTYYVDQEGELTTT
jgi:hypothetical protein